MASGRLNLLLMVTSRISLDDLPAALREAPPGSAGKTLVRLDAGDGT